MPLHPPVRAAQKTATAGTGAAQLLAPSSEFRTFKEVFGASPVRVAYVIAGQGVFETGFGLFNGEDQIARDGVLNGSNGANPVNLPAGQKDIFAWWAGGGFERYAAPVDGLRPDDWMGMVSLASSTSFALPSINTVPYGFEATIRCVQASATVSTTGSQTLDGLASVVLRSADTLTVMRDRTQWRIKHLSYGGSSIIDIARSSGRIVGEVLALCANVPVPSRCLPCDGRNVSRSAYSALFGAIGTAYGAGDGSTTFGVPDMRGRAIAGADAIYGGASANRLFNANPGWAGGEGIRTLTEANLAAHFHGGSAAPNGNHTHTGSTNDSGDHTHTGVADTAGAHSHTASAPAGAGVAGGSVTALAGTGSTTLTTTTGGEHGHNIRTTPNGNHAHAIGTTESGNHQHAITTDSRGGGAPFQIVQPTMAFNVVIYAGA